jgi:hypothetical protein
VEGHLCKRSSTWDQDGNGELQWPTVVVGLRWMDRRHWLLLLAAIACIAGLLLWIGEIDLGMEDSITPAPAPAAAPQS